MIFPAHPRSPICFAIPTTHLSVYHYIYLHNAPITLPLPLPLSLSLSHSVDRIREGQDSVPADESDESWWERWGWHEALVTQIRLPRVLRAGIPLAILGTVGMFVNSNLTPDAVTVMATIDIGSKVIAPDSIFDFGLANTVQDST